METLSPETTEQNTEQNTEHSVEHNTEPNMERNGEHSLTDEDPHPETGKAKTPFEHWLKRQFPGVSLRSLVAAVELLDHKIPVPYIAFFCREKTGGLRSNQLFQLQESRVEWDEVARRQQHMLKEIEGQGKLTPEFKLQIERSSDLDRLEDLYAPFKLKRQTLGVQAKAAGLGQLADHLWTLGHGEESTELKGGSLEELAQQFIKADSKFPDTAAVLKGVQDILIERIAEVFELRALVRAAVFRRSKLTSVKGSKAKPNSKYSKFFSYQEPIGSLTKSNASHRYLVIRKGWMEDELVLSFERPDEGILSEKFEEYACTKKDSLGAEILIQASHLALKGNVYTVMENEAHRHLKEHAEQHVIENLSETLRKKLLQPGLGNKPVMGIDPGTANHPCSFALLDEQGKNILNLAFKLEEITEANRKDFLESLENLKIQAIAIAHGPRAKEIREKFKQILSEAGKPLPIVTIHEHSASIYASSPGAKEEFPALDLNARRAIFVSRYLQDPLSAFAGLDPKFFSLGELQHEVNQGKLRAALLRTMEICVNFVGMDPNLASALLLSKISGISDALAKEMVQYRETVGKFKKREDLKKVKGLEAVYEYCAGFLRFTNSEEPLDRTFIHPALYPQVHAELAKLGVNEPFALGEEQLSALENNAEFRTALGDASTQENVIYELRNKGVDPRGEFRFFDYAPGLNTLADLKKDIAYAGIVTNVTSFGAFVDIGIEQDGLVHISELAENVAKNPFDSLYPGDPVTVWVTGVNEEKKQISFTMKDPTHRPQRRERPPHRGDRPSGGDRNRRPPRRQEQAPAQGAVAADGSVAPAGQEPRQDRRPREHFRRDQRQPREGGSGPRQPREGGGPRQPREGGDQRQPREGEVQARAGGDPQRGPRDGRPQRPDREKKPQKTHRDPKTGAVVKMDEDFSKVRGLKLPAKAKPHTFNPFANLATILKDKQSKDQE